MSESDEPENRSLLRRYGPLLTVVVVLQVGLAWLLIHFYFGGSTSSEDEDEELFPREIVKTEGGGSSKSKSAGMPFYYASTGLSSITVNPAGTNAQRFAMINAQLGLVAHDRSLKPQADNITGKLKDDKIILGKVERNLPKIRSIISQVVRKKTIDELTEERVGAVEEEVRNRLNREVFEPLFTSDEKNKKEVRVQEVVFSDLVIQ